MSKIAVIFGATGQDGSYLAEHLLDKGYKVIGICRRSSSYNKERIDHLIPMFTSRNRNIAVAEYDFTLQEGDITDPSSVNNIIEEYQPDYIYGTAAQSHVATSFEQPSLTFQVNTIGVLNILEGIRHIKPDVRFLQYSSSEQFGNNGYMDENNNIWQNEDTPFKP